MPSLTLTEARTRAEALRVVRYDVTLDVRDPAAVTSHTRVRFTSTAPTAFAELVNASDVHVTLDGVGVDGAYRGDRVHLDGLGAPAGEGPAEHLLEVRATLPYVHDGEGLHTYTDPSDGARYVGAYCGMDVASKVFCCFDQPDLKAPIGLTVEADPEWTVIGNGQVERRYGGHVELARTPPISTYLFAFVAGPLVSYRWEHAGLPFGWHACASLSSALTRDAPELRAHTERCFAHYTETFDPPYAFDSCDQVFVPGLNWGALEQPGCILYRDEMLPADEPTPEERMERAVVVAHEMAHLWFGDLATMRWWDDSWLNESFADLMGYQVAELTGYVGGWVSMALVRKHTGYDADARRSTHPIAADEADVADVETAFGNFDMVTYAKGAAVLRQLLTFLGPEDFLRGVNGYLSAHAFGNADLEDFLTALDRVSDKDVRSWARDWLQTTGFDTLRVTRDGDVPVVERVGSRPHRFTATVVDADGRRVDDGYLDLAAEPVRLEAYAGRLVLPNSADETFARLDLDAPTWAVVEAHLGDLEDPLTRAVLWNATFDRVADGRIGVTELLALAGRHLRGEVEATVTGAVLGRLAGRVRTQWVAPEALAAFDATLTRLCRDLLADQAVSPVTTRRVWAAVGQADLRQLLDDESTDQRTRWTVVRRLQELGDDPGLVDEESGRDRTGSGRLAALTARAARPDPDARAAAWAGMTAPGVGNRDFAALAAGLWTTGQPVEDYAWRYLETAPRLVARGQGFAQVVGRAFPYPAISEELLAAGEAAAEGAPSSLRRVWRDRLDDVAVALRVRSAAG